MQYTARSKKISLQILYVTRGFKKSNGCCQCSVVLHRWLNFSWNQIFENEWVFHVVTDAHCLIYCLYCIIKSLSVNILNSKHTIQFNSYLDKIMIIIFTRLDLRPGSVSNSASRHWRASIVSTGTLPLGMLLSLLSLFGWWNVCRIPRILFCWSRIISCLVNNSLSTAARNT